MEERRVKIIKKEKAYLAVIFSFFFFIQASSFKISIRKTNFEKAEVVANGTLNFSLKASLIAASHRVLTL